MLGLLHSALDFAHSNQSWGATLAAPIMTEAISDSLLVIIMTVSQARMTPRRK